MRLQRIWCCALSAVMAAMLGPVVARAQSSDSPLDALLEFYFSRDAATTESYLLKSTRDQIDHLNAGDREFILNILMIAQVLDKQGIASKRPLSRNPIVELQEKNSGKS